MKEKKEILDLLPKHKFDNTTIDELLLLEDSEIELILLDLLIWLKNMKLEVVSDLLPVLLLRMDLLKPKLIKILEDEKEDSIWKYNIITYLLVSLSVDQLKDYHKVLNRIIDTPTDFELHNEVVITAKNILNKLI